MRLVDQHGRVDLLIGGEEPGNSVPWPPLGSDDYLVMFRLYRTHREVEDPLRIERVDDAACAPLSIAERADRAAAYLRDEIASTVSVIEMLRESAVNAYPPAYAEVHQPRYTGALFPTLDNGYHGFFVDLDAVQSIRLQRRAPSARFWSLVFYDRRFNTPDFNFHCCYLTRNDAATETDGTY